jgi:hypothetical protein
VDEPRDQQADAAPRAPKVAAASRLSPNQEAYGAYTVHRLKCANCRDTTGCAEADRLRRDWLALADDAFGQLDGEIPSGSS